MRIPVSLICSFPVDLTAGAGPAGFRIHIGPKPSSGRALIRAVLEDRPGVADARLAVRLNSADCPASDDLDQIRGLKIPCRILQFDAPLAALRRGCNDVELSLLNGDSQRIVWLEVYFTP